MLKTSPQPIGALPATGIDESEVVSRNNRKLAKSYFTKPMHRVEKFNFLTFNAR